MKETRSRLLETAREMFSSRGYDQTTVEAIIEKLGLSKGAFYHHFSSKEALLDGVIDQLAAEGIRAIAPEVDAGRDAIDKLNRFQNALRRWRLQNFGLVREMAEVLARDENAIISQKLRARNTDRVQPLLAAILRQGIAEGAFQISEPDDFAWLLLTFSNAVADAQFRDLDDAERVRRRMLAYFDAFERLLGAPSGSLDRPDFTPIEAALKQRRRKRS